MRRVLISICSRLCLFLVVSEAGDLIPCSSAILQVSPMQSLRLNPILNTDSYKLTHWWQYPADTRHIYSYLESRGGMFEETMLALLQYIIKCNFAGQVFTLDDVEEARRVAHAHFSGHPKSFNYEGFKSLYAKHGGRLPLRIRAVKEGTVVKSQNALITIENTDPEFYWLTNWAETVLLQVWYPITVATLSRAIKQVIGKALVRTGDPSLLSFKLHDFGFRGVSSKESAAVGGAAHLLNFLGTDTLAAIQLLNQYYSADLTAQNPLDCAAYSIPASEHSTITAWGEAREVDAYANILENCPDGLVACVSDSYDIYNAVRNLWGGALRDNVLQRNGTLVIRPDSGDAVAVIGADDESAVALQNLVAERAAPEVADGVVNIVGIADARDEAIGAIFKNIGVSVDFACFAPRGDGGMLGGRNAVRRAIERVLCGEIGRIKLVEKLDGGKRVRAEEIEKMGGAADGCGFFRGHTAKSEVVQLEREQGRIASADEGFADDLLDGAGKRGDGNGIPDLEKYGFRPVGEPIELRVGVLDGDEGVLTLDDGAFLDGADAEGQAPAVLGVKRSEAFVVEGFGVAAEVSVGDAAGFLDVVEGEDLAGKIGFEDVLQHGEHGFVEHAATGLDVGIDVARVRRILPPVGELVGVRVEDGIESQRLHGAHWDGG